MNKRAPIGIFDSGVGGLTVASAIKKLLPNESIIYFGDTAHLPYGDKSAEAVKGFSKKIAQFLKSQGCKIIVIACNSASSAGYGAVQKIMGEDNLTVNVIDPVVEYLSGKPQFKKVGVIGTKRTISSRVYAKKIKKAVPDIEVKSLATPLLASMIEEGFFNNNISQTIINSYLSKKQLKNIDSIVLACTHYPLIQKEITNYYKKSVDIIDSPNIVAKKVKALLKSKNLLSDKRIEQDLFYVSDYTHSFENTARMFFSEQIKLKQKNIWK